MRPAGGIVKRGFTTVQLLQLAATGIANAMYATGNNVRVDKKTGARKEFRPAQANDVGDYLREQGIPIPKSTKANPLSTAVKAGWFSSGKGKEAFSATSIEGGEIEKRRSQILTLAKQYLPFLSDQPVPVQGVVRQNWEPSSAGKTKGAEPAGGKLKEVLATSYSWKGGPKNPTLSQLYDAVLEVMQHTGDAQPTVVNVVQRAGGAFFQKKPPASIQNVNDEVGKGSGFLSNNVLKYLTSRHSKDNGTGAANVIRGQINRYLTKENELRAQRREEPLAAPTDAGSYASYVAAANPNIGALHKNLKEVVDTIGADGVWQSLSGGLLRSLLSGQNLSAPAGGRGKREWDWLSDQGSVTQPSNTLELARYAFDTMLAQYLANGATIDQQNPAAASSGARGGNKGLEGILGVKDESLKGLSTSGASGQDKVRKFIKNAVQGKYSMDALKEGARLLGVAVDQSAVLHDVIIAQLANAVLKAFEQQVNAAAAGQGVGNGAAVAAAAAALGISGYSNLKSTPDRVREAALKVLAVLDAKAGRLVVDCSTGLLKKGDLKRVAKARRVKLSSKMTQREICAAIQAAPGGMDAPTMQVSGSRQEKEADAVAKVAGARKARTTRAVTDLAAILPQGLGSNLSARSRAVLGGPTGQQVQGPITLGRGSGSRTAPVPLSQSSGSRTAPVPLTQSSGSRTAVRTSNTQPAPTAGPGLVVSGGTGGTVNPNLLNTFGNQLGGGGAFN